MTSLPKRNLKKHFIFIFKFNLINFFIIIFLILNWCFKEPPAHLLT